MYNNYNNNNTSFLQDSVLSLALYTMQQIPKKQLLTLIILLKAFYYPTLGSAERRLHGQGGLFVIHVDKTRMVILQYTRLL